MANANSVFADVAIYECKQGTSVVVQQVQQAAVLADWQQM
jgi:hypothetical protein